MGMGLAAIAPSRLKLYGRDKRWPAFRPGRVFCTPRKGADELWRAVTLVTHAAIKLTSRQAAINQLNLKGPSSRHPRRQVATGSGRLPRRLPHMKPCIAKFAIGQVVKHRKYPFRGIIYDVDPVFANTEEWWQSIPEAARPRKNQPFYHLFAENADTEYIAYVSEQNLLADTSGDPIRHPQVDEMFVRALDGAYKIKTGRMN